MIIKLNFSKCKIISFRRSGTILLFSYKIDNQVVTRVTNIKDLGVTFSQDLRFKDHIIEIVASASKCLGFLLNKSKNFAHPETCILLFNTLVRSRVKYCVLIWNSYYDVYSTEIEKIQKDFLNFWHIKKIVFILQEVAIILNYVNVLILLL